MPVSGSNAKISIVAGNGLHPLILMKRQFVVFGNMAIIFERFQSRGLRQCGSEWNVPNLEQLRCSEEHHVIRIVIDGINQASLVDDESFEARLLRLDGARQTRGATAHDQDITLGIRTGVGLSTRQSFWNLLDGRRCEPFHGE